MTKKRKSVHDTWLTPRDFYDGINAIYGFDPFDPFPPDNDINEFDGLKASWAKKTFANPPYSRTLKEGAILKAIAEWEQHKRSSCLLIPASTSTVIFHEVVLPNCRVKFIKGRLAFEGIDDDGNWCNPRTGMWELKNVPEGAQEVRRSGQMDSMLVFTGDFR